MAGGRYSKIHRRMWNDDKFRKLSKPQPCGQALWFRFLCGPELGPIPGLFSAREPGLADAMGWQLEPFRQSFRELSSLGLVEADWEAGLVWVQNAIKYNEPANPNVVKSWSDAWAELPECALKSRAFAALCSYMNGRGESFLSELRNHCPNHSANHCPNQDQDQDQEQEGEKEAPETVSTEQKEKSGQFLPTTPERLKCCLDAAMQKRRPERCPYSPGQWWDREAGTLLRDLGDPEKVAPEILRRIGLFVADDRMAPWTVKRFCAEYNGIGVARPTNGNGQPARKSNY